MTSKLTETEDENMKASQTEKIAQPRILLPILNKLVPVLVLVGICAVMVFSPRIVVAQESEFAGIEEIIVTARRREENLQDVPISISAFTAQAIEKNMFADVAEYLTKTPNASFVSNGARSRRQISIRGVTNFLGFVGSGTTGFYIDDFSIAGSTINPPIMDIERIEILRGPQSTYFGRNALGGGINITSKKPTNEFHGSVMADYSSFSTIDVEGVVNVPMGETLAMRFNSKIIDSDGNIKNVNPIGGGNNSKYEYVKASLRWTPSENLTVDATFQYADEHVGMREGVPSGVFSPFGHLLFGIGHQFPDLDGDDVADPTVDGIGFWPENDNQTNFNHPQNVGTSFRNGVVRIDYQGKDLLFTSITGFINSDFFLNGDIDGSSGDWFHEYRNIERRSVSTEFRVQNTNDSAWRWNIGGLYAEDAGDTINNTFVGSVPIPGFGAPCCFLIDSEVGSFETDYSAIFGQVDYDINDKLTLSLGGRYSEEKKQDDTEGFSGALVTILSVEGKFTDFSPKFAISYQANDTLTYYGTISKGYKSGGVQIAPVKEKETFDPEELWNYEIGFKANLIDHRLHLNAALFYMDWKDLQVSFQENLQNEDGDFILFGGVDNADSATSKGAELGLTALAGDNLLLNFNVGYLDAKFDSFVALIEGANHTLDGRTIPNSPKWTMSADAEYGFTFSDGYGFNTGYVRLEWVYRDNINPNTRSLIFSGYPWEVPDYNYFNLRIGAESENLAVVAYVENLFDKTYYTNAYQKAFAGGMFIEPSFQRIGLRATYKFGN